MAEKSEDPLRVLQRDVGRSEAEETSMDIDNNRTRSVTVLCAPDNSSPGPT